MLRIAVATSDGQTINEHFGKARNFIIYEVADDGGHRPVEKLDILPHISNQQSHAHASDNAVAQLEDVDVVLALQIGPGAIESLLRKGIRAFSLHGAIDKALTAYGKRHKLLDLKIPGVSSHGGGGCGGGCVSKGCN